MTKRERRTFWLGLGADMAFKLGCLVLMIAVMSSPWTWTDL